MALQKQTIRVSFSGLDSKSDPKQLIPGKLVTLQNGRFSETGQITKRPGFTRLSGTILGTDTGLPGGVMLGNFKNDLLVGTGKEAYAVVGQGLVDKGEMVALECTSTPVRRDGFDKTSPDLAVHPVGITLACWEDGSSGSMYSIIDTTTGATLISPRLISATAQRPHAVLLGNFVGVFYYDTTAPSNLSFLPVPVSPPYTALDTITVTTDISSSAIYDITSAQVTSSWSTTSPVYLVHANTNVSTDKISVRIIYPNLSIGSEVTIPGQVAVNAVSIFQDYSDPEVGFQGPVWIAYQSGTDVKVRVFDNQLLTSGSTVVLTTGLTIRNIGGVVSVPGTASIFFEVPGTVPQNHTIYSITANSSTVLTEPAIVRSLGLASEPFVASNGGIYVLGAYQSTLQPSYFVLSASGHVHGKLGYLTAGGLTARNGCLPAPSQMGGGCIDIAILESDRIGAVGGQVLTQRGVFDGCLDFTAVPQVQELSDDLHIAGGILYSYDGAGVAEHGFHVFPEGVVASASLSGGNIAAGQYQYMIVYEWPDAQGLIHQSSPNEAGGGVITTVVAPSTGSVTLTIPTLRLTAKENGTSVALVPYRSLVNQTGPYYRLTPISASVYNIPESDSVVYVDTHTDASIIGNSQLYGGFGGLSELGNQAAPNPSVLFSYANRLMIVPSEQPLSLWYSKTVVQSLPVEFNPALVLTVPQNGGPITAGYQMDDKCILFKESSIYYFTGFGPAANGTSNDFGIPQFLSADAGCTNQRSIIVTPMGLMFQSLKGIYLLGRDLSISYVGAPVEGLVQGNTVTSAVVLPDRREVRFTLDDGIQVSYDYFINQWSSDTNIQAVDSVIFQRKHTYLRPGGPLLQEVPTLFTDNGSFIPLLLKTGWLSLMGLQGYGVIWNIFVLGDYRGAHSLQVDVGYDFDVETTQRTTWDAATILAAAPYGDLAGYGAQAYGGSSQLYQLRVDTAQPHCSSIQITLQDTQTFPYTEGMALAALAFDLGVIPGSKRLAPNRQIG